ncbi:MAG: helix-turn-helix domain-containing protein [Polyangiales bacterium]
MTRRVDVRSPRAAGDRSDEDAVATPSDLRRQVSRSHREQPRSAVQKLGPSPASLPELAAVGEVAAWLKTTPKAIYAMVERAQLPGAVRIGRRLLFERAALVHWLSERRVPSPLEQRP